MEALCLPEQLSSFHQRTLAQMGKPIIVELFGTGRRSIRATGRGDEGQAGNHDLHNVREFNQELPGMEGSERGQVLPRCLLLCLKFQAHICLRPTLLVAEQPAKRMVHVRECGARLRSSNAVAS